MITVLDPASGLPTAFALRIAIIAVTMIARGRNGAARRVAFVGSAIVIGRHRVDGWAW